MSPKKYIKTTLLFTAVSLALMDCLTEINWWLVMTFTWGTFFSPLIETEQPSIFYGSIDEWNSLVTKEQMEGIQVTPVSVIQEKLRVLEKLTIYYYEEEIIL